ncbi:uncharacterized protein EV422DRAFT_608677 [Fimicolochytrium jonesii]|uniref:uncharacterized protein n=1 Tax=Fimicolochytrium jonesii TaxID=1396493 RepID=UPI0022FE6F34|nr:uncharacterized protein EV422DRAFT_608677 [Fimicolochytrium jonesii]KAI8816237.1 hypothetical protein EV422DRAFT_608677 [Fimicolochytrium jonesii]
MMTTVQCPQNPEFADPDPEYIYEFILPGNCINWDEALQDLAAIVPGDENNRQICLFFHHEVFVDKMIEMVKSARLRGKAIVHFLRYVGMFETPTSTPAVRLHQDLATTAALFPKVGLCLQELAADDERDNNPQWAVYEFTSVRIPAQSTTDPSDGGFVERTLISLFGYDNLVNVQHGGFFASYAPSIAHRQLFQGLNTSFGQTFAATAMIGRPTGTQFLFEDFPQTTYTPQVVAHFNNVSTFIRNNPSTLANMDYAERWNQFLIKSTIYQVF